MRGVCWESEPAVTPTRNCRAAGLDVKNDKSRSLCGTVAGVFASPSFFAIAVVVRIERNWAITTSLRAFSCFSERFSFLVSCSFLRWVRIVSGVGSSGEEVNCRFYKASTCAIPRRQESYLVMLQSHPRDQVLGEGEDVPQHVNLKLIKGLIDSRLKQSLQLV